MKQFINTFLKFALFAAVFYVVLIAAWSFLIPFNFLKKNANYPIGSKGFTYTRLAELDTIRNVDVLFLGSSHACRGFDTRLFQEADIRSFNLGSPSQTPIQTKQLIDQYLDQLNPKLIVYEVYPATFVNDGVESSLDIIANSEWSVENLKMVVKINHFKTYNTFIYDSFREVFALNDNFQESNQNSSDTYINGGFVSTSIAENGSPITEQIKKNWKDQWELNPFQIQEFKEALTFIKKRNVPFILIQMPVTKEAYHLYKNNDEVDDLFDHLGDYTNLNKHTNTLDDQSDFMDYHHLNQSGVNKINLMLIEQWKREYPTLFEQ